jgi:methylglutaconyl-CoA hydratase
VSDLITEQQGKLFLITMNRVEKHNAFDDSMLAHLQLVIEDARDNPDIAVIILMANGPHFSAGADVSWMQRMTDYDEKENVADAMILAQMMNTLHICPKPTIAMVQGAAFGGGAGMVAACDIAIATDTARFCFSEVKFGLIPAVISPYVIKAIGERAACELFMTASVISAKRAYELNLIQHCVPENELLTYTLNLAEQITQLAPQAVRASKSLVRQVAGRPIDEAMLTKTATLIAQKRVSVEGQHGLKAFLSKKTPRWY